MTMISRGVEISIAGGGGEMVRGPIPWSIFFFLFYNHARFDLRYKQPHAARAIERKKPINNSHDPPHLFMGKMKHPKSIGKVPRLAPKIKPQTCKETIHRNVQVERPKPFRRLTKTKEKTLTARNAACGERIVDPRHRKSPVEGLPKPCCTFR